MVQRSDGTLRVVGCGFEPPPVGFPPVTIIHGGLGIILWKDGEVHLYDVGRDLVAQRLPGSPSGVLIAVCEYVVPGLVTDHTHRWMKFTSS